jgi:hypothetical protein
MRRFLAKDQAQEANMKLVSSQPLARIAAALATMAFAASMLLQLLLAAGVLPITLAWGGSQPVLPTPLRLASLAAIVLLGLFIYVIRWRAGVAGRQPVPTWVKVVAWVITLFLTVNTLGNAVAPSAFERFVSGSISLIAAVACLLVSVSKPVSLANRLTPAA